MAHTSCMLDKQGYMHARACTRPRAGERKRTLTHTRARAHTHTHTQICNIYCFFTATMLRERASMLRYTYIACLVIMTIVPLAYIFKQKCSTYNYILSVPHYLTDYTVSAVSIQLFHCHFLH